MVTINESNWKRFKTPLPFDKLDKATREVLGIYRVRWPNKITSKQQHKLGLKMRANIEDDPNPQHAGKMLITWPKKRTHALHKGEIDGMISEKSKFAPNT